MELLSLRIVAGVQPSREQVSLAPVNFIPANFNGPLQTSCRCFRSSLYSQRKMREQPTGEHPVVQHSTPSVQLLSSYCSNWNVIVTINWTAIGSSFRYVGSYFHFFKASNAAWYSNG